MGFFDTLFGALKEAGDAVQGVVNDVQNSTQNQQYAQNVQNVPNAQNVQNGWQGGAPSTSQLEQQYRNDSRSFDEKFNEIMRAYPDVSVDREIPAEAFEQQAGCMVFARGGNRCLPDPISYRLRRGGREYYIRLWKRYEKYDHAANRQIRAFCDSKGIPMLDFFEYLPNGFEYMRGRIAGMLG